MIVIAKTNSAHIKISEQFSSRSIKKTYYALAWGKIKDKGIIEGLIVRDNFNRTKFKMSNNRGKSSKTTYSLENYFEPISLVKLKPETGRTHQIRVHMASKGNSIVGDKSYGKKIKGFKNINLKIKKNLEKFTRQALHAKSLGFVHPRTNREVFFEVKRPNDFDKLLKNLKKYGL